ncbi:hypothetical protein VXQ18_06665, partial [Brucella abortus]|nr:hypothetical protein [Brucella abortus]
SVMIGLQPDAWRKERQARLLRRRSYGKYQAPVPLSSIHNITTARANREGYINQLQPYGDYFQCGISFEHKFALNQDHFANS